MPLHLLYFPTTLKDLCRISRLLIKGVEESQLFLRELIQNNIYEVGEKEEP